MSKLRPADRKQLDAVILGIGHLKHARAHFTTADCPKTLKRIRKALTSAGGALRHVERRARSTR